MGQVAALVQGRQGPVEAGVELDRQGDQVDDHREPHGGDPRQAAGQHHHGRARDHGQGAGGEDHDRAQALEDPGRLDQAAAGLQGAVVVPVLERVADLVGRHRHGGERAALKKSNTLGRRPVAALGMAGYAVSMLLFGTAAALALAGYITGAFTIFVCLLLSRSLFGMFGSGTNPAAQAYVADRTGRHERTEEIAAISSGFSVGAVAGPAFAAALVATLGLLSPVFIISAIAALMSLLIYTRLPEKSPPQRDLNLPPPIIAGAKGLWRDPRVMPYLIYAVGLSLVTGVLTQTYIFAVMDKMGVAGTAAAQFTGPAFSVGAMATLLAQLVIIPRLKLSSRTLMMAGALSLSIGALLIIPTKDFAVLVVAQFAIGLGQGLARPGFSSGASLAVGPELQGNVAGLVIAANGMGFIISPFFGPWMYEFVHPNAPFLIAAALLIGLGLYAWSGKEEDLTGTAE